VPLNPFRKLAGQTAIYGLPTIAGRLLNYLLVPLYTRAFVPAEYGVVTEVYAYVAFLFVLLTYGMETAFFRFASREEQNSNVFATAMASLGVTSTLFTLAGLIFAPEISAWMGYGNHPEYIRWFILILATDALSTIPYAKLRLDNRPLRFALIKIVNIGANISFNLFFILLCPYLLANYPETGFAGLIGRIYSPETGIGYIFISNLIASLLTFALLLPDMLHKSIKPDPALLKKMLAYSWPLLIFGMAGIVNETFDRVILKHLLPGTATEAMAQLGIYGACYKVSILMTLFIQTYRYAAEPFFFDQARGRHPQDTYARMMHYFLIVCLFIFLSIMLFIDVVMLFVGEAYREGARVVPVLLFANLFLGVFYNLSIWFKLTDKTTYGALISVIGAGITLLLNFLLIPPFGYMGAAWATFACYASMMVISYFLGRKYYPVNYNLAGAAVYTISALSLYGLSLLVQTAGRLIRYGSSAFLLLVFLTFVAYRESKVFRRLIHKA
jgi:O-antigen/teichoic acid export membrane protein